MHRSSILQRNRKLKCVILEAYSFDDHQVTKSRKNARSVKNSLVSFSRQLFDRSIQLGMTGVRVMTEVWVVSSESSKQRESLTLTLLDPYLG